MLRFVVVLTLLCAACTQEPVSIQFDFAPCTGASNPGSGCRAHLREHVGDGANTCLFLQDSGSGRVLARLSMGWSGVEGRRSPLGDLGGVPLDRPVDVTAYVLGYSLPTDGCEQLDPHRSCAETDRCLLRLSDPAVRLGDAGQIDFIVDGACQSDSGESLREGDTCDGTDDDCDLRIDETAVCRDSGTGELDSGRPDVGDGPDSSMDLGIGDARVDATRPDAGAPDAGPADRASDTMPDTSAAHDSGSLHDSGAEADMAWRPDACPLNACGVCGAVPSESCNGEDDDCDGTIDEGFAVGTPCAVGRGECAREGVEVCAADGTGTTCPASAALPSDERCNGLDDDCDGTSDESFEIGQPCMVGTGACEEAGERICADDGRTTVCPIVPGAPEEETCNDVDDDCDGSTDESPVDVGGLCETGESGACSAGSFACRAGLLVCEPQRQPRGELCDDVDDDCDGQLDEDFEGLGQVCTVGQGACARNGLLGCSFGGADTVCLAAAAEPSPEQCNGTDDDCDGDIDEGALRVGEACTVGLGDCLTAGVFTCGEGPGGDSELICDAVVPDAGLESCGGGDEDCDGVVDEGCESVCDGLDEDGDGRSDEGCAEILCGEERMGREAVPPCNGCPNGVVIPEGWVCIPPGTFQMGSEPEEEGHQENEAPAHLVRISYPFLMMATEVTQRDWRTVAQAAGVGQEPSAQDCDDCPVNIVSWFDAIWYASELSRRNGVGSCYMADLGACQGVPGLGCEDNRACNGVYSCPAEIEAVFDAFDLRCAGFRLATEAEWEYAIRAGTFTTYWPGDIEQFAEAEACGGDIQPVASRTPNRWGLWDLGGNVQEWVHDWAVDYCNNQRGTLVDPIARMRDGGSRRVRGGTFGSCAARGRSAYRGFGLPTNQYHYRGFRLVRPLPGFAEGADPHPDDAAEVCNQVDDDCDGTVDEDVCPGAGFACRDAACAGPIRVNRVGGPGELAQDAHYELSPAAELAEELVTTDGPADAPVVVGIREIGVDGLYWRLNDDIWWDVWNEADRAEWCARFVRFYRANGEWLEYADPPAAGQLTAAGDNCEAPRNGPL